MNGVHDMGGMQGFGPVKPEANEPVFHGRWEARVLAMRRAMGAWRKWNIDAGRYSIETPRFATGATVRARDINPIGHTRLPRYVRGRTGTIESHHGAHVFPDTNARFEGEKPQILYTVRFEARELWGKEANPADAVYVDLWEDYLEAG